MQADRSHHHRSARRRFLHQSVAVGAALLLPHPVAAAAIAKMEGEVFVNGRRAARETPIKAGDTVKTGAGAMVAFTLGADAFLLRQMATIVMEGKADSLLITGLRVVTGAVLAVFGPGMRNVMTGLVTAAIRGTGVYVDAAAGRSYFCTCYGDVGLTAADGAKKDVITRNHSAHYIHAKPGASGAIVSAPMTDHSNEELAMLEKLVGRVPRL